MNMKNVAEIPPRRILMCVSGMSPAVITETLFVLLTQDIPFVPDEIHVVTTATGKGKVLETLLKPHTGHFYQMMHDYSPGTFIRFDADTVHVIGQTRQVVTASTASWLPGLIAATGPQFEDVELDDITSDADNKAAADTIYRVMRELKNVPSTKLHASVAGGRKSMSFYMGHAFSLLADIDDTLSHVLINDPFENSQLNFFYPPRRPLDLEWTDSKGEVRTVSTDQADVKLAELSVLKLGGLMGKDWPAKAKTSFDFAVRLAQAALAVPNLVLKIEDDVGFLEVCGECIELPPQQFAVFALYALARKHANELPDGAALAPEDFSSSFWEALSEKLHGGRFSAETKKFDHVRSKIHDALLNAVGPVAHHFKIGADAGKKKSKGTTRQIFLNAPPELITLVGSDFKSWWQLLKTELLNQPSRT